MHHINSLQHLFRMAWIRSSCLFPLAVKRDQWHCLNLYNSWEVERGELHQLCLSKETEVMSSAAELYEMEWFCYSSCMDDQELQIPRQQAPSSLRNTEEKVPFARSEPVLPDISMLSQISQVIINFNWHTHNCNIYPVQLNDLKIMGILIFKWREQRK